MRSRARNSKHTAILMSFWGAAVAIWVASSQTVYTAPKGDVLSLGGTVTEIIYALGEGHRVVARDSTSLFPEEVSALPDVGYLRALSPEGVLSVAPELIISEDDAGPVEAIDVVKAANIPFVTVPEDYTADGIAEKIRIVGEALGVPDRADVLAAGVTAQMTAALAKTTTVPEEDRKRVLFILSAAGGPIMASGTGTGANAIIELAGAKNAITDFEGYKPVTDEAISLAAPDVILMMDRHGGQAIADDDLLSRPALQPTPAAQNNAVVRMNGLYLLGFGPRTAQAVVELNQKIYGP